MHVYIYGLNRSLLRVKGEPSPGLGVFIDVNLNTFSSDAWIPKWTHSKIRRQRYRPGVIRSRQHSVPSVPLHPMIWNFHQLEITAGVGLMDLREYHRPNISVSSDSGKAFRTSPWCSPVGSLIQPPRLSDLGTRLLSHHGVFIRTVAWSGFCLRSCSICSRSVGWSGRGGLQRGWGRAPRE